MEVLTLTALFAAEEHVEVEAWGICQRMIAAHRHPDRTKGRALMQNLIGSVNGRLEPLCGSALGFRNLTNYIARSLLETVGFRPLLHPGI